MVLAGWRAGMPHLPAVDAEAGLAGGSASAAARSLALLLLASGRLPSWAGRLPAWAGRGQRRRARRIR